MKFRTVTCFAVTILLAVLVLPLASLAQHPRYKLVDIPTLGGPAASGQNDGPGLSQFINEAGIVVGSADTSIPCNNPNNCPVSHAFRWQNGLITDLGALPGMNWSGATSINARGWATGGGSSSSAIDPFTGSPAEHAILWKDGEIVDLGTFGTGVDSAGLYVNNAGEIAGFATVDTTLDPFPNGMVPFASPVHAFIWRDGVMRDLGTLGGLDSSSMAGCNNQRVDSVSGWSYTDLIPNPTTGIPTQHAFFWQNGVLTDIPTLGGTFAFAQCANNRGHVVGQSSLTGDVNCVPGNALFSCDEHSFLWHQGKLMDLGTLGGSFSVAIWLNNAGEAVGNATTTNDESFHATLWKNGEIIDLGTLEGDCFSQANAINSSGQIIGQSTSCDFSTSRAVVWTNGTIVDLNTAISPNPTLQLVETDNINDHGEIVGRGLPPGCDDINLCGHAFLLIPCDEAGAQSCQGNANLAAETNLGLATNAATATPDPQKTREFVARFRARLAQRFHLPLSQGPKP